MKSISQMAPTLPLTQFPLVDTSSVETAEDILSRELSRLRIVQVADAQSFRLRMHGAKLGDVLIGSNRFDAETSLRPGQVDDSVVMAIGHEGVTRFRIDEETVLPTPTTAAVITPSRWVDIERAPGSSLLLVRAPQSALTAHFEALTGRRLREPLLFERRVDLTRGLGATALRLVQFVANELDEGAASHRSATLRSTLRATLLSALLHLPNNGSEALHADPPGEVTPRLIRVVEEFLEAAADEPISIVDVLEACDCTRAVLFATFQSHRAHTPMQFLQDIRLGRARARLSEPEGRTVTEVALASGFTHMSRFAASYRTRFGELPSETLRERSTSSRRRP